MDPYPAIQSIEEEEHADDGLDPLGQVYGASYTTYWDHMDKKEYQEANEICRWLLRQPRIGPFHADGAHLNLAYSPDCYVQHAKQAVELYQQLVVETDAQLQQKECLLDTAKSGLEKAERDHKCSSEHPLNQEEYEEAMNEAAKAFEEYERAWDDDRSGGIEGGDVMANGHSHQFPEYLEHKQQVCP